jgi:hypothetical protein
MFEVEEFVRDIDGYEQHVVVPGELRSLQPAATFDVQVHMASDQSEEVLLIG